MFDCVLCAAGASLRMRSGDRGGFKPLLPFSGGTMVEAAAQAALGAGCRLLVVVGHRGSELAEIFRAPRYADRRASGLLLVIENIQWQEGLVGSIQAALPAVEGEAFFVCHADMPFVATGDYAALASAWAARAEAALPAAALFASFEGMPGHPVLLPSAWIPEILRLDKSGALKPFLSSRPRSLVETGERALRDIDTPGDYERARSELAAPPRRCDT